MQFHELAERLTRQLDELRDRTAESLRADSDSFFREVHQLRDSLGELEERLDDRLDRLADEHADALHDALWRGTTWPRRLFWLAVGAGAGAAAAYLISPARHGHDDHHLAPPPST